MIIGLNIYLISIFIIMDSYILLFTLLLSVLCVKNSEYGIQFSKRNEKANHLSRKSSEDFSNEDLSLLRQRRARPSNGPGPNEAKCIKDCGDDAECQSNCCN